MVCGGLKALQLDVSANVFLVSGGNIWFVHVGRPWDWLFPYRSIMPDDWCKIGLGNQQLHSVCLHVGYNNTKLDLL